MCGKKNLQCYDLTNLNIKLAIFKSKQQVL